MQWGALTEEKQKNQLAHKELRFIITITITRKGITITITRKGNHSSSVASNSALHCSRRWVTSRWPLKTDQCSGEVCLKGKNQLERK
jgi:hypothetical protein